MKQEEYFSLQMLFKITGVLVQKQTLQSQVNHFLTLVLENTDECLLANFSVLAGRVIVKTGFYKYTDGPERRFRSLVKVCSSKESLSGGNGTFHCFYSISHILLLKCPSTAISSSFKSSTTLNFLILSFLNSY